MQKTVTRTIRPVYWLGAAVSASTLLWLLIFQNFSLLAVGPHIALALAALLLQTAAFLGATRVPGAAFWPGACMVGAAVFTFWAGLAGPCALYGYPASLQDLLWQFSSFPLILTALPAFLCGLAGGLGFLVLGGLSLANDARQLVLRIKGELPAEAEAPNENTAEEAGQPDDAATEKNTGEAADEKTAEAKPEADTAETEPCGDAPEANTAEDDGSGTAENHSAEENGTDDEKPTPAAEDTPPPGQRGGADAAEEALSEDLPQPGVSAAENGGPAPKDAKPRLSLREKLARLRRPQKGEAAVVAALAPPAGEGTTAAEETKDPDSKA